jgi:hypothetical protein
MQERKERGMDFLNIIQTVGFPIFAFIVCGLALKYVYDKERKSLDDTIDKIGALTMAVEHNSEALRDLTQKIGKEIENDD